MVVSRSELTTLPTLHDPTEFVCAWVGVGLGVMGWGGWDGVGWGGIGWDGVGWGGMGWDGMGQGGMGWGGVG